jgi:hypothetical protein
VADQSKMTVALMTVLSTIFLVVREIWHYTHVYALWLQREPKAATAIKMLEASGLDRC